jgi:hypothetical protein
MRRLAGWLAYYVATVVLAAGSFAVGYWLARVQGAVVAALAYCALMWWFYGYFYFRKRRRQQANGE